jgi:peptidoglycan/LPS O-acetylase OafA/YrhL
MAAAAKTRGNMARLQDRPIDRPAHRADHPRTVGQALAEADGIGPGFNLIRLGAALAVLVSHGFDLTGNGALEPLRWLSGGQTSLGGTAVALFFIISGFLVTSSLLRAPSLVHYARNRALRICPALFVVVILSAFVLGPALTRLPLLQYLGNAELPGFLGNIVLLPRTMSLPGVFDTPPPRLAVAGSLWTLPYEGLCYALLPIAAGAGLLTRRRLLVATTVVLMVVGWWAKGRQLHVLPLLNIELSYLLRFLAYFAAGVALHVFRDRIVLSVGLAGAALALVFLFLCFGLYHMAFPILGGYLVIFLGLHPKADFKFFRDHDLSYGVYLYAWPMQALVLSWLPGIGWWNNILLSAPPTLLFAALSWRWVERPALSLKRRRDLALKASTNDALADRAAPSPQPKSGLPDFGRP